MREIIIEVPDNFGQELKPEKVNSEIKGGLVRCQDCKYWPGNGTDAAVLPYWLACKNVYREPNYYCADAKRRVEYV